MMPIDFGFNIPHKQTAVSTQFRKQKKTHPMSVFYHYMKYTLYDSLHIRTH